MNNNRKLLSIWSISIVLTVVFSAAIMYPFFIPEDTISPSPTPIASLTPSATPSPNPPSAIPQTITPSPAPPATPIDSRITYSQGIEVYGGDYPNQLTAIDWETIFIQTPKSYNISILNSGDKPIILYLAVNNWTPGVDGTVTWSYEGKVVAPREVIPITLSLKIESANVTSFSNDITITFASIVS